MSERKKMGKCFCFEYGFCSGCPAHRTNEKVKALKGVFFFVTPLSDLKRSINLPVRKKKAQN